MSSIEYIPYVSDVLRVVNKVARGQPLGYGDWNHFQWGFQISKAMDFIRSYPARQQNVYNNQLNNLRRHGLQNSPNEAYRSKSAKRFKSQYSNRRYFGRRYRKSRSVYQRYKRKKRFYY